MTLKAATDAFMRHSIAIRIADRDKLAGAARESGISQGDLISELIDFASHPSRAKSFKEIIEKRQQAKAMVKSSRRDILRAVEDFSPEQIATLLNKVK